MERYSMISVDINDKPDVNWNNRLLQSKFGNIFQTKEYAMYVEDRMKSKPIYLKFHDDSGKIIGQLVVFQTFKGRGKAAGLFGRGFLYSIIAKISSVFPKYTYWQFGPVIFDNSYQDEVAKSLGDLLKVWKGHFKGSPHPLHSGFDFSQEFVFQKQELGTFIIDLKEDLQTILEKTDKKSVKKNIERSQNRGVMVKQISSKEDLMIYHEILNNHRKENNLTLYSIDDTVKGFEMVRSVGQIGFLAWKDEVPIGGIFASSFNGYINEWGIARTKKDLEEKLYAQDLLRWKIIEWGVQNNCNFYDLSGVKLINRDTKEDGIFRNKEKWGGMLIKYPIFFN